MNSQDLSNRLEFINQVHQNFHFTIYNDSASSPFYFHLYFPFKPSTFDIYAASLNAKKINV